MIKFTPSEVNVSYRKENILLVCEIVSGRNIFCDPSHNTHRGIRPGMRSIAVLGSETPRALHVVVHPASVLHVHCDPSPPDVNHVSFDPSIDRSLTGQL